MIKLPNLAAQAPDPTQDVPDHTNEVPDPRRELARHFHPGPNQRIRTVKITNSSSSLLLVFYQHSFACEHSCLTHRTIKVLDPLSKV